MSVIYIVLPLALLVVAAAVAAFVWATRRGQFDDLDTPAVRILHDVEDEEVAAPAAPPGIQKSTSAGRELP